VGPRRFERLLGQRIALTGRNREPRGAARPCDVARHRNPLNPRVWGILSFLALVNLLGPRSRRAQRVCARGCREWGNNFDASRVIVGAGAGGAPVEFCAAQPESRTTLAITIAESLTGRFTVSLRGNTMFRSRPQKCGDLNLRG
jgi:hypothetical protein